MFLSRNLGPAKFWYKLKLGSDVKIIMFAGGGESMSYVDKIRWVTHNSTVTMSRRVCKENHCETFHLVDCTDPSVSAGQVPQVSPGSRPWTAMPTRSPVHPPEFLLDDHCRPASLPSSATCPVAPVILLDQHSSAPALLELLLFIVTSEFALDKDGSLRHLFIKCILQGKQEARQ